MADFTYTPSDIQESCEFAVDEIQFGDGYSQRSPMGINNALRVWQVQFSDQSLTNANAIRDFFVTRMGSTSFTWRPQGFSVDVRVVCKKYSRPIQNRFIDGAFVYTVNAEFKEVPL